MATLQTLADYLEPDGQRRLLALLPEPLAAIPEQAPRTASAGWTFDRFCQTLADRQQADTVPIAVFHARCVIQALREVRPLDEIDALAASLGRDFAPLFWPVDPEPAHAA